MIRSAAAFLAGAMLIAAPAAAQVEDVPTDTGDSFTIGAGIATAPSYEGSDNYRLIPGGFVRGRVSGYSFFTRGLQAYLDVVPEKAGNDLDISVGPVAGVRLNRTGGFRDDRVRALGELNTAFEVGGFLGIAKTGVITSDYDNLGVRVTYVTDVGNAHESHVITPAIEYGTPLSRHAFVGASVSADFVGDGYADYYFSVSPAGALASGLSPYDADGGFKSWSLNLFGTHSLTGDLTGGLSIFALGSYTRLRGDFRESPIVSETGSPNQWFGAIGIAYSF